MDDKTLKLHYDMILSAWKMLRDHKDIKDDDSYWQDVIKWGDAIVKEFKGHRFARELVYLIMFELNETATGKQECYTNAEYDKLLERRYEIWNEHRKVARE